MASIPACTSRRGTGITPATLFPKMCPCGRGSVGREEGFVGREGDVIGRGWGVSGRIRGIGGTKDCTGKGVTGRYAWHGGVSNLFRVPGSALHAQNRAVHSTERFGGERRGRTVARIDPVQSINRQCMRAVRIISLNLHRVWVKNGHARYY
jgi:hypothetical protein